MQKQLAQGETLEKGIDVIVPRSYLVLIVHSNQRGGMGNLSEPGMVDIREPEHTSISDFLLSNPLMMIHCATQVGLVCDLQNQFLSVTADEIESLTYRSGSIYQ
jgi:hypothetical protein